MKRKNSKHSIDLAGQKLIDVRQHLQDERDYSESIIETIRKPLLVLDKDLRVVSAGRAFYDTFKVKEKETEGKLIYKLGNGQWNIPALKVLLSNVLSKKSVFQDYEIDHEFKTIGKKHMILNGREIKRGNGKSRLILLAIEDVTEKRKAIETIKASNQELTAANQELSALEQELRSSNQQLIAHEQQQTALEQQLKSSNQQLTAHEQQLKSSNQQLTAHEKQQKGERGYAESIIDTIREPLLVLDKDLRVVSASRSFYNTFKVKEKETEKKLVYELGNGQWNIPALKTLLTNILPKKSVFQSYEIEHEFTTIGKKNMILNARELKREGSEDRLILLAIEDVTEKRKAMEIIKAAEQQIKYERDYSESIIGTIREPILVLDRDLRVVSANRAFYGTFKVKEKETEGNLVYELGNGQWNIPALKTLLTNILPKKNIFQGYEIEHEFKTIGKKNMILNARELKRGGSENRLILLAIEDVTEKRKAEEIIKASNQQLLGANQRLTAIEQQLKDERDYAESIIGTIRGLLLVLDKDLRVVSASRSFYEKFKVKEKETEGKLVYKLGNGQWNIPALKTLLTNILPKKSIFQDYAIEHEFKTIGKKNLILNARELKRENGKNRLILLAIEDITETRKAMEIIKAAEQQIKYERDYAESIIGTIREPLLILDKDLRVVSASRSFYDTFKVKEKETEGKLVYKLGNGQWNIPALKTLLTNILPKKNIFQGYEIEHEFKTIGKKNMILNARELKRADGESRLILLAIEDVTEKRKAEEIIKAANQKLTTANRELTAAEQQIKYERDYSESIIGTMREPLLVLDKDLRVVSANRAFYGTFKVKEKETEGNLVYELGNGQWNIPALKVLLTNILPKKSIFQSYEIEHEFKTIGKKNMILNARELKRGGSENRLILLAIEDVTEKRKAGEIIKAANQKLTNTNQELTAIELELRASNRQLTEIEEQLKDERDYAESIIGTIREPLLVLDKDLRVVSASRSFYDTFKVKAKETEGNLVYKLGNEQWNIPALRILLTNILPEKSVFQDYEVEHEFKTIGKKNMILNAKELKSENHKNRLILLAIEDVTEKRKAEEKVKAAEVIKAANEQLIAANKQLMSTEQQLRTFNEQLKAGAQKLQESELKYRTLFETSVDGILIAEIETRKLVYANPSICKMLGYTKEELENMSITDIYPKDNNDNLKNNISKFGSQKEGVALEADIPCLKKNTEIVYVDINVTVASIDGKECNVGFFRDVVIRKKAQDDLIKSDNKYQYLIENLNEGVWVIDRDNLTTFTNERMAKMLGYEAIEMIGKSFFSFMDAVGIKIAKENMERQKNGIKEQHDFEFQKKYG